MPHRGEPAFRGGDQTPAFASGELLKNVAAQINAQRQRRELRLRQAGATAGLGGGEIERLIEQSEQTRQGALMQAVLAANVRRSEEQDRRQREQRFRVAASRERRRREGLARETETRRRILGGIGTIAGSVAGPAGFALGGGAQGLNILRTLVGLQARSGGVNLTPEQAEGLGLDPEMFRQQRETEGLDLDPLEDLDIEELGLSPGFAPTEARLGASGGLQGLLDERSAFDQARF